MGGRAHIMNYFLLFWQAVNLVANLNAASTAFKLILLLQASQEDVENGNTLKKKNAYLAFLIEI